MLAQAESTRLAQPNEAGREAILEARKITLVYDHGGWIDVHLLDHSGVKTGKTVPVKKNRFTIDTGRDATPYYLITY